MSTNISPFISIVLAFYNEEIFLREAVESVIAQDYKNWELILVDDGSSDASTLIAKDYAANPSFQIIYVDHTGHINKGLSPSRNLGILNTSGDFIAFLDADDIWEKNKISNQVNILLKNPEAFVVFESSLYWYSWNSQKEDIIKSVGVPGERTYQPPQLALRLYPLNIGVSPCPSSIMIKKTALLELNGFEESFTGIYSLFEDQAFLFKVYLSQTVYISTQCNNRYRQRQGSIIYNAKISNNKNIVLRYYLKWAKGYLKTQEKEYKDVEKLLSKALRSTYRIALRNKWQKLTKWIKEFLLR